MVAGLAGGIAKLGVHPTRIKGLLPALLIAYGRGA
jgi:hypothetical protein